MPTPLMKRLGNWLGTWRGPIDFADGRAGLIQFDLTSLFFGEAIQVEAVSFDAEGAILTRGWGFISLDRKGHVVNNCFGNAIGFAVLHETPDDEEVLSLTGQLAGNQTMDVTMNVEADVYSLSVRVYEGYHQSDDRPRTYTRMKRVGNAPAAGERP